MSQLTIEYCVMWNYYPRAASLAEQVKNKFDIDIEFMKSDGGRFEIYLDGDIIFSKMNEYRFPDDGEIEKLLQKRFS